MRNDTADISVLWLTVKRLRVIYGTFGPLTKTLQRFAVFAPIRPKYLPGHRGRAIKGAI